MSPNCCPQGHTSGYSEILFSGSPGCSNLWSIWEPSILSDRLLKNAHLLRFPNPSSLQRTPSMPHSSGFLGPCIWAFLSSLRKMTFSATCSCHKPARCMEDKRMDLHLKDKVVLVTGSGDGIGRRAIMMFAEEGAHVIVSPPLVELKWRWKGKLARID